MLFEISRVFGLLKKLNTVTAYHRKALRQQLNDIDACIRRYRRALVKNDISAMRQASAEFTEIIHAFERRLFIVIDTERNTKLIEQLISATKYEELLGNCQTLLAILENDERFGTIKDTITQLFDTIQGRIRGLSKSLK